MARIGHRLVAHYFLLTEEDLENWEMDAEEFAIDEGGESWKFQVSISQNSTQPAENPMDTRK